MYCIRCGKELPDGQRFCTACGTDQRTKKKGGAGRIAAIVLAVALGLGLLGVGGYFLVDHLIDNAVEAERDRQEEKEEKREKKDRDEGDEDGADQDDRSDREADRATASPSPKSGPQVFKLGGCAPLTGPAALYGSSVQRGAALAVEEINAADPDGLQLELRYEDDAHNAEKSVNAYNVLKDWGMQVFLGSATSAPGVATSVVAYVDHIFCLTPSASSADVLGGVADPMTGTVNVERKDNVFQLCFADFAQGAASAQYIADRALGARIAVIYKSDDVYSTGVCQSFAGKAAELGLNVVSVTAFTEDTKTDFSVQLDDAYLAGADLVFLPMYYDAAALIFTQANAMGYAPKWFGIDGMDGILSVEGFDTSLAEGVMLLTPFNADAKDEKTRGFVAAYQGRYGEKPNQFAAAGYDCVYAIYQALIRSNATADMSASELCDLLMAQFPSMTFNGLTGQGMTWGTDGAVSKSPKAMVVRNGVYVGM